MAERRFKRYTLDEYVNYLKTFTGKVRFSEIHVHHTYKPTIADYRSRTDKETLIRAMWHYHTRTRGWQDIAQHATVDPDGYIWDGRPLTKAPASATGYNDSDDDNIHPFMFEMIGNFDIGQDRLEGLQRQAALGLAAAVVDLWDLSLNSIRFHREMAPYKSCPGTGVDKAAFVSQVNLKNKRGGKVMAAQSGANSNSPEIFEQIRTIVNDNTIVKGYLIEGKTYVPLRGSRICVRCSR